MEGLTVGRMVHYVWRGVHRAAVVTRVHDKDAGLVNVFVFPDAGEYAESHTFTNVSYSDSHAMNTWHWIEAA